MKCARDDAQVSKNDIDIYISTGGKGKNGREERGRRGGLRIMLRGGIGDPDPFQK